MRMIEQLVKVLAKILFNKESGNYEEANNNIDNAFRNILGLDSNLIYSLSARDIISLLSINKENGTNSIKYIVIAKLLREQIEIKNLNNKEDLVPTYDYQKVLDLYLEGILNNTNAEISLNEYCTDVKEIVKILKDEIPNDTRFRLFKFYEILGEYDKANDELSKLGSLSYPEIKSEGIKFYKKLENLDKADLQKGNLSKEVLKQSFEEFMKSVM